MLTSDPCPSQIYAQKESQRAGYIELALQAYEQMTAESTAAWLTHSYIEIYKSIHNEETRPTD